MLLSQIQDPRDIRSLTYQECDELANELRTQILTTVSQNGGHLASNLGIVEITIALHRVFNTPQDKIIFDVGHQTYAHKILTGRYRSFHTIRTFNGLSGFPKRSESEYDCFETGHASTSVSAALGFARARDQKHETHHVIAVIGDGALTGGLSYEALNDCGNKKTRLIVLLNDNGMSIAKNVGALSQHLYQLRASKTWHSAKSVVKNKLVRVPVVGKGVYHAIHWCKDIVKKVFLNEGFFTSLGFHYLGPVDGNDIRALEKMLKKAKTMDEPVLIHCVTLKGRGCDDAEMSPEIFHGTKPFRLEDGKVIFEASDSNSAGTIANKHLCNIAKTNDNIAVITAAMPLGSATSLFQDAYPNRFFDVGIAEEHAVTLSAGMASGGLRPFFFVYSTFLQRAYDEVLNDVCLQNLPVTLMIDRAGFCDEDGQTHHGIYDIAYLLSMPNIKILAPYNEQEMKQMINAALQQDGPIAIRYPKSFPDKPYCADNKPYEIEKWTRLHKGEDGALLAVGTMVGTAMKVADELKATYHLSLQVINASTIRPLDESMLTDLLKTGKPLITIEEHSVIGGFGSFVQQYASAHLYNNPIHVIGVNGIYPHGAHSQLLQLSGLDAESITRNIHEYYLSLKEIHPWQKR